MVGARELEYRSFLFVSVERAKLPLHRREFRGGFGLKTKQ